MASRLRGYEISKPQPILRTADQPILHAPLPPTGLPQADAPAITVSASGTRPLSDIRELTEPSLIDAIAQRSSEYLRHRRSTSRANSVRRNLSIRRDGSVRRDGPLGRNISFKARPTGTHNLHSAPQLYDNISSSSYSSTPEAPSVFTIPQSSVPRRSSSFTRVRSPSRGHARKPSIRTIPQSGAATQGGQAVPNRGQGQSPVKHIGLRLDPVTSSAARRVPSRTCIRSPHPSDILEYPTHKHPRVKLELHATAPVFVGGGSVEGFVRVTVDDNERLKQRRSLGIAALSVDLIGYEDINYGRRASFLALGTELLDANHLPPPKMAEPVNPLMPADNFWTLSPSTSALPFMISLPLDTGPPPFQSKVASIRFLLCTTAVIRDAGKLYRVRTSQEVQVLPTYDPERALTSLPSPLTAADELHLPRAGGLESIKITAGLHRQVWVSGSTIFVDVHIGNRSHKLVKRLDLSLERDILCYKHAAASTREKSAGQARIFESNHQTMVAMSSLRNGTNGWNGIEPHTSETRTCDLELPRGHATVRCGKYFEVRYFLNITVSISNSKLVSVQLPIILIHMNSLDVVPNSVAQVAAAIEEKRAHHERRQSSEMRPHARVPFRQRSVSSPARTRNIGKRPSFTPGRAFAAPRQQSLDRQRACRANIEELCQAVDSSPRKHQPKLQGFALRKVASNISFGNLSLGGRSVGNDSTFRAMAFRTPEPKRPAVEPDSGAESVDSIRERMRRMASFNSLYSKKSVAAGRSNFGPWQENVRPAAPPMPTRPAFAAHSLGLPSASEPPGVKVTTEYALQPATDQGFRERQDRSRFEFQGVRRKPSARLRERGINWWEQVRHKAKEKEGWI
ncbi:hypothetical protein LTR36_009478 [Oleoguttula mirabilis]|uniref:Arrestin C-terminal-like domain-containing protein n=1 Tax=Oleoguttula mirabilis TaxID=1507867 RepID=A0AAV9JSW7_9PEZI|nr:hypothetical protein LTR36_009478 [Oleoguttula mirabilis]